MLGGCVSETVVQKWLDDDLTIAANEKQSKRRAPLFVEANNVCFNHFCIPQVSWSHSGSVSISSCCAHISN